MNPSLFTMRKPAAPQRGFSLITTLILLIVVTVLGLAASRIVLMSEKTSRFDRDTQIAFQAAEAALVDAEIDIQGTKDAAGNCFHVISPLRPAHRAAILRPSGTKRTLPCRGRVNSSIRPKSACQANIL